MRLALCLVIALCLSPACAGEPADVAGNYSIAVTNRANGCGFDNWQEGNTAANIPLEMSQDGSDASAVIGGVAGAYFDVVLGGRTFAGEVDGDDLHLTLYGTRTAQEGNCIYSVNASIDGTLDGDVLTGFIHYAPATNGNPDCAAKEGCASVQEFNGTRPPR